MPSEPPIAPISATLSALAWKSWVAAGAPVAADELSVPAEIAAALAAGTLIGEGDCYRLVDAAALVQGAADYAIANEQAVLTNSGEACFRRLHELWIQDKNETHLPSHILAALHNRQQIDAYVWARAAVQAGVRPYEVTMLLEDAVASFTHAAAAPMVQFFAGDYAKGRHVSGASIYPKLEPWLNGRPELAHDIKRLHEQEPRDNGGPLYGCALQALVSADFATGWPLALAATGSANPLIAGPALHVLGLLDFADPAKATNANDVIRICSQILHAAEHPLVVTAIGTLACMVSLHEATVVSLLDEASKTKHADVLQGLAIVLFRHVREWSTKPWFWNLVLHLTYVPAAQSEILSTVDSMLGGWLKDPHRAPRVIEFLNLWMARQSPEALKNTGPETVFDYITHALAQCPAPFSSLITAWLLDEDRRYPHAIHNVIGKLRIAGAQQLSLDAQMLDTLNTEEFRFLLRRMIGYLSGEEILLPLVFSMVRTHDAKDRTFALVAEVIRDYLAQDYPGHTLEFLKARQAAQDESEDVKIFCGSIVKDIEAQLAELDALPNLKEFHTPAGKSQRFLKERNHQMNKAMEEARKNSLWTQIATEIPLKGGTRTFHRMQGKYTAPMELKPMSHSIAIPLSEVSDPLGSAHERLRFRSMKKPPR